MAKKIVSFLASFVYWGWGNNVLIPLILFSVVQPLPCWDGDLDGEGSGVGWLECSFGKLVELGWISGR